MTTRPLTPPTARALEVLAWIHAYQADRGYAPKIREVCDAFGWSSPNAAALHIARLERRGLLDRVPFQSRTMQVTEAGRQALAEVAR